MGFIAIVLMIYGVWNIETVLKLLFKGHFGAASIILVPSALAFTAGFFIMITFT